MKHKIAYLSIFLFSTLLVGCSSTNEVAKWHSLSVKKIEGISGIAVVNENNFLVVHDNKKLGEPRLSLITSKNSNTPVLKNIDWCNKTNLPVDLEAITSIPNNDLEYLVLESKGKITRIKLDNNDCKTLAQFDLPNITAKSNMEGLALHCFSQQCVLVWAERGDDKQAAKLSWAKFDVHKNVVAVPKKSFDFFANYPNANRRSISDISIDAKGGAWVVSTSDPGDNGPFQSALYKLGTFSELNSEIDWQPKNNVSIVADYGSENVKIEGITFTKEGLIMGSDDENKGSKIAIETEWELQNN
jgi:hypothetical protein